jgi:hypothetical protein
MTETIMTLQTSSPVLLAPARETQSPSFWRRLLNAIMAGRQRKVDAHIAAYLARHRHRPADQPAAAVSGLDAIDPDPTASRAKSWSARS